MRIRDVMTRDPVTVTSETLILDARRIMKERNFRRLPVVDHGKLVGIVTLQDINEALPPPTSSTSAHEFHMFSRMKVKEIMKTDPLTISPEAPFEEVVKIGQEKKISSFLVVEDGKLVGIATESDLVRFIIQVLGLKEEGSRITIEELGGKFGELQQIVSILDQHKTPILSMVSFHRAEKNDWMIVLRVKSKDTRPVVEEFQKAGFKVTYAA